MPPGRRVNIRACCGHAHRLSSGDIETHQIVSTGLARWLSGLTCLPHKPGSLILMLGLCKHEREKPKLLSALHV